MYVTKNFTLDELIKSNTASKLGIDNTPNKEVTLKLIELIHSILQPIRDKWDRPITVTSGYRCPKLNKAVGGVNTSQHVYGEAADIICSSNKKLYELIVSMVENKEIEVGQVINEHNYKWIHISLPTDKHKNEIFAVK